MNQPTKELVATKCSIYQNHFDSLKGKLVCDFDLTSNEYAWVSENNQHLSGETNFPKDQLLKKDSELYKKFTTARCKEYEALRKNLLAGRDCNHSSQCKTYQCDDTRKSAYSVGKCKGNTEAKTCATHDDCDNNMYCKPGTNPKYLSTCKSLNTAYQSCSEDAQCLHYCFCWFPAIEPSPLNYAKFGYKEDGITKQCLPVYSQGYQKQFGWGWTSTDVKTHNFAQASIADMTMNGKYCDSGLAVLVESPVKKNDQVVYAAECASVFKVMQGDKKLDPLDGYKCDPTDNSNPCKLYYNTTEKKDGK